MEDIEWGDWWRQDNEDDRSKCRVPRPETALTTTANISGDTVQPRARPRQWLLIGLVVLLFFAWGFTTVLNDSLIPKLKGLFGLSYTEVMLTQFSFFVGYFFFYIPAGFVLSRIGYIRGAILGLVVMTCGCLLFWPAAASGFFPAFLFALFVIAAGITLLQVVANPFVAELGPEILFFQPSDTRPSV